MKDLIATLARELKRYNDDQLRQRHETPEALAAKRAFREPMTRMAPSVLTLPALAAPFTDTGGGVEIPGEYWTLADLDVAVVSCPCAEAPELVIAVPRVCQCGRGYLYTGRSVRVAFSPKNTLPVAVDDDE